MKGCLGIHLFLCIVSLSVCCTQMNYVRNGSSFWNFKFSTTSIFPSDNVCEIQLFFENKARVSASIFRGELKANVSFDNNRSTIIADISKKEFLVQIRDINFADGGIYSTLNCAKIEETCVTLYVLGRPSKPTINVPTATAGSGVTLSCSSNSTSKPALDLVYEWNFNTAIDNRFNFSQSGSILMISNVIKEDSSKEFSCTAKDMAQEGLTSESSSTTKMIVHYGPESLQLNPSDRSYEKEENTSMQIITCIADCNPPCTFRWTFAETGITVNSTSVLQLGTLSSSKAGTYQCTATRSGSVSLATYLTLNVIYGPRSMSVSPSDTTVRENEDYLLPQRNCTAQCWQCDYVWAGPQYSSNGSILNIGALKKYHSGIFTCTATNMKYSSKPQLTSSITIEVRYGPGAVRLTPNSTEYIVDEMTQLSIICEADCFPVCTYRWTKEGQSNSLSTNGTLALRNITKDFTANYTCTTTNTDYIPPKSAITSVNLKVRYGPYQGSILLLPPAIEHTVNESNTLSNIACSTDCFPHCDYSWRKIGSVNILPGSAVLSLGSVFRGEAGIYECTAINPDKSLPNTATKQVKIIVNYGPDAANINVSNLFEVTEGNIIPDITCFSDCHPNCSFTWMYNNGSVISDGILSLQNARRQQAGNYTCTSRNVANSQVTSKTIKIVVKYPPEVNIKLSSNVSSEGTSLTLICEGKGVPASYTYSGLTQKLGSMEIPNSNQPLDGTEINSSLHFAVLQLADTGTYTCLMNNGITGISGLDQSASLNLFVHVLPKVLTSVLKFAGATKGFVTVLVPFYCYPPVEYIKFVRLNRSISGDGRKYNVSMVEKDVITKFYGKEVTLAGNHAQMDISELEQEDFGTYTLYIKNAQGEASFEILVTAESPPSVPTHFYYVPGLELPSFVWSKEFNGGHNQTFVIATSIPDSGYWTNWTSISEYDKQHQINDSFFSTNISGLQPGTYTARLIAWNFIGEALPVYLNYTFTLEAEMTSPENPAAIGAIAGGVVSAVIVLVIVSVVLLWRRKAGNRDKKSSHAQFDKHFSNNTREEENSSDEDVMVENNMYESAGQITNKNDPVYNKPTKILKVDTKNADVYAVVNKTKKEENPKVKKGKTKKTKQIAQGDIYENAAFEDNLYENPKGSIPSKTQKKNVNQDGLIYADLAFNDQPKGQKKLVIHGLDEMTTYVQVDFNRKADPLPDSDTEEQSEKKPK